MTVVVVVFLFCFFLFMNYDGWLKVRRKKNIGYTMVVTRNA